MKRSKVLAFMTIAILSTGGVFQNCSNARLESAVAPSVYSAPTLKLRGEVCPQVKEGTPGSSKFIFMLDLSASNFGDWIQGPMNGTTTGGGYWYWDKNKQTDEAGNRFKAIKEFITNCSGQTGAQFSVVGFSRTAGILEGTGASAALNCANAGFTTAANAGTQLDNLLQIQKTEAEWYYQWTLSTFNYLKASAIKPPVCQGTSYNSALKCAEKVLVEDLTTAGSNTQNYHAFLISDGVPMDEKPKTCPTGTKPEEIEARARCEAENALSCEQPTWTQAQKDNCYMTKALSATAYMRQSAISAARDLRLYGVYYGGSSTTPAVLNGVAIDGGSGGAIKLNSFEGNQKALCDLVITKVSYEYKPDTFMAVNMTALRREGKLLADSDMDGLTDEDEIRLGYDQRNPRSRVSGVLDSICERLGGVSACQARRNTVTCNPSLFNSTGMSDCDYRILYLDKIPSAIGSDWGVDSDNDGVLDIIEILKGTDPASSDMARDLDGDGISNLDEIVRGSDPYYNDANTPLSILNETSVSPLPASQGSSSCAAGGWTINLNRMQVTPTLAVSVSAATPSSFTHPENQQMIMIYYRLSPQNSTSSQSTFFGRVVRVNVSVDDNGLERLSTSTDFIPNDDFRELGKVNP